jgi:O-antigen/teichoic acid export membrane protein
VKRHSQVSGEGPSQEVKALRRILSVWGTFFNDSARNCGVMLTCLSDQVIFSATHFLVSLLFGRLFSPTLYGAFSIAFAAFLLIVVVQYGLILEPMIVLGVTRFEQQKRQYVVSVLICNAAIGAVLGVAAGLALALSQGFTPEVVTAASALAVTSPFLVTAYALRRSCYVFEMAGTALLGSTLYCGGSLAAIGVLWFRGMLSPATVFFALAVGAALSAIVMWRMLPIVGEAVPNAGFLRDTLVAHWGYGSWATGSLVLNWLFLAAYYPVLGRSAGLESAATLRAFDNFFLPVSQVLTAVSIVFLPRLARLAAERQFGNASRLTAKLTAAALAFCVLYFGFVWLFDARITRALYPDKPYGDFLWIIPWTSLAIGMKAITDFGMGIFLRACQKPDLGFGIIRAGAFVTIFGGLTASAVWGLEGAVVGRVLAVTAELVFGLWQIQAWRRDGMFGIQANLCLKSEG